MKIINVVGARPNFMKIAPIIQEVEKYPEMESVLVHTGQHYDYELSKVFFKDLNIPEPDFYFEVGSLSHARQTAQIMIKFEEALIKEAPDLALVVGDVNSTVACALACAKLNIPLAHVEAGLRSFDREMPEEINRIVTDVLSDFLFATSTVACENLKREGIPKEKIFFVGDVMIDTLFANREKIEASDICRRIDLDSSDFAVLTLHRPKNVDRDEPLKGIIKALKIIQKRIKVVFPIHPRTRKSLRDFGLDEELNKLPNLRVVEPLCYVDFLGLVNRSRLVLTDSGCLQSETTILGIPCLTLRENTERVETVSMGTNQVIGIEPQVIVRHSIDILEGRKKKPGTLELCDGCASQRILQVIAKAFGLRRRG